MYSILGINALFKAKALQVLHACRQNGVEMNITEAIRDPLVQATYWKQSRSPEEVREKIDKLRKEGAHFIAFCLERSAHKEGPLITNALPGMSWHQWGEALDCIWVVNGEFCSDTERLVNGVNGYQMYAAQAQAVGLDAGYYWESIKDAAHIQLRQKVSPEQIFGLQKIDKEMRLRYADMIANSVGKYDH